MSSKHPRPHIAISGDLGSGKSTVARALAKRVQTRVYSTGDLQRRLAAEYHMTSLELNHYAETHPEIDEMIDTGVVKLAQEHEGIIFDSRLAWHFVPDAFKVYLTVDLYIAAERIAGAQRGRIEAYHSIEEAREKIAARRASENLRYDEKYDVHTGTLRQYDLVIDTGTLPADAVVELIVESYTRWQAQVEFPSLWLGAKTPYPTRDADEIAEEPGGRAAVIIVRVADFYFIARGHQQVSAAMREGAERLPCRLLAQDDDAMPDGETARALVNARADVTRIQAWERQHQFCFPRHPELPL